MIPKYLTSAVLFKLNKKLRIINLKIPKLKSHQILVKIFYTGICRSQIMEIFSGRSNKKWLPHMLGHEATGEIIQVGQGVKKFKKKDKVILTWIKNSSVESDTPIFYYNKKIINAGNVTTFNNYSIVSENRLIKKPKSINYRDAVLLGCCFMTGPGMVYNETKPKKNSKVVIIGLGAVGLGVLLALKQKNINSIVIIEKNKKKIKLAKKMGIKLIINKINKKSEKKIYEYFGGKADICYESAGVLKTIEFGLKLIKDKGRLHFASHPHEKLSLKIKPYEFIVGKKISGSWGGGSKPDRDIKKYSQLIMNNKNIINKFLSKKNYSLININQAISDFMKNKNNRPIIKMSHQNVNIK